MSQLQLPRQPQPSSSFLGLDFSLLLNCLLAFLSVNTASKFNPGKACLCVPSPYCPPYLSLHSYQKSNHFPRHTGVQVWSVVNFSFPTHSSPVITLSWFTVIIAMAELVNLLPATCRTAFPIISKSSLWVS